MAQDLLLGYVRREYARRAGGCAAMDEIADWLNRLGMSEYAECFTENGYVFA
jgi:hypothetical protein